jgi:hypothetical protein
LIEVPKFSSLPVVEESAAGVSMDVVTIDVPPDALPGATIKFRTPDGRTATAVVPQDMHAGGPLNVKVSRGAEYNMLPQNAGDEDDDDEEDIEAPRLLSKELFHEDDYPNGDGDIVLASMKTGLVFHELVQVVWRKRDTIFRCDMATIGPALFQFLDKDGDGGITRNEVLEAMGDERLVAYVKSIKCPILTKLFAEKEASMLRSFKVCSNCELACRGA